MVKKITKKVKNYKKLNIVTLSLIIVTSYIISFILQIFRLPYIEDLLRLICENCSSYKNKVKPFFRVEIGASEKSAGIRKTYDKKVCFCHVTKAN